MAGLVRTRLLLEAGNAEVWRRTTAGHSDAQSKCGRARSQLQAESTPTPLPKPQSVASHRPETQMPRDYEITPNPKGGGEIRIHGEDGKIRQSDAIATPDPFPPRG